MNFRVELGGVHRNLRVQSGFTHLQTYSRIFRMSCWHSIHGSSTTVPHADVWLRNISSMAFWWGSTLGHAALRVRCIRVITIRPQMTPTCLTKGHCQDPGSLTYHQPQSCWYPGIAKFHPGPHSLVKSCWVAVLVNRPMAKQPASCCVVCPLKVSSSAKTHSPSQEQLGFFETWIDQNIQNSSQFYHHCSVSKNHGGSSSLQTHVSYCWMHAILFHPPFTGLVLCTPFCWLNCPSCFKHTDIVGYSSLQYPLVTLHFNLSCTHLKYYALIMPCFLLLVISHGCIFQLLLVELLLLDQPKYCSKWLNTLDKANIDLDVEPPPLANLSFGESIWHMCSTDSTVYKGYIPRISRKTQRVYPLSPDNIVGFLPPCLWLEISPSYIVLTIRAFHHQISPWNHCFSTESNHFIWRIWECYCI